MKVFPIFEGQIDPNIEYRTVWHQLKWNVTKDTYRGRTWQIFMKDCFRSLTFFSLDNNSNSLSKNWLKLLLIDHMVLVKWHSQSIWVSRQAELILWFETWRSLVKRKYSLTPHNIHTYMVLFRLWVLVNHRIQNVFQNNRYLFQ